MTAMPGQRGFILAVTLIILALLSAVALRCTRQMAGLRRKATLDWRRVQAMETARSGVEWGRRLLERDDNRTDGAGDAWFTPKTRSLNNLKVTVTIEDETGKVNINRLFYPSGEPDRRLMGVFRRLGGASEDMLIDISSSYHPFRFRTPGEPGHMLLHHIPTPHRLLTVFGSGHININAAPEPILKALPGITSNTTVQRILNARRTHPFTSPGDVRQRADLDDESFRACFPLLAFRSSYFTVRADVALSGGYAHAEAIVWRNRSGTVMLRYREWFS